MLLDELGSATDPEEGAALAVAIDEMLAAPERAREMGRLGRRIVRDGFSAQTMVRQMEELYLQLLHERGVVVSGCVGAAAEAVSGIGGEHA